MLLIKKNYFYFIFLAGFLIIIGLGFRSYFVITEYNTQQDVTLKYYAENFFYLSVIFSIALLLIMVFIRYRTTSILKELDKIIELSKYGSFSNKEYLIKLGPLGDKINNLNLELSTLNEKKSLKISSLFSINNFLFENMDLNLFLTDIQGKVISCSKKFLVQHNIYKKDILDDFLNNFTIAFDLDQVIQDLENSKTYLILKAIKFEIKNNKFESDLILYPIFNYKNELSNIICILESQNLIEQLSKKADLVAPKEPKFYKQIFDFFKQRL